jgi:hypothetical protein
LAEAFCQISIGAEKPEAFWEIADRHEVVTVASWPSYFDQVISAELES